MLSHVTVLGAVIWGLVVFGVMVAVGFLAARLFPGDNADFLLELPPIRRPVVSNILIKTAARIEWYLKEVLPLFVLGTALLFVLDRTGALTAIRDAAAPVVVHWLGLPWETADAFVVGFLRRDYGAVFLLQAASGPQPLLSGLQIVVSMIVITLFIPCVANVFIIVKEHGWKIALGMAAFIFPFAFLVGGLVRLASTALGLRY
jgi:ferrous iron transport protein B